MIYFCRSVYHREIAWTTINFEVSAHASIWILLSNSVGTDFPLSRDVDRLRCFWSPDNRANGLSSNFPSAAEGLPFFLNLIGDRVLLYTCSHYGSSLSLSLSLSLSHILSLPDRLNLERSFFFFFVCFFSVFFFLLVEVSRGKYGSKVKIEYNNRWL